MGISGGCGINAQGAVQCWGGNGKGELGNNDPNVHSSVKPLTVVGLPSGVQAVFGNASAHCALKAAGSVVCWGDSVFGEITGVSDRHFPIYKPYAAPGLSAVASFGIGLLFHCAVTLTGNVKCYGLNSAGQLGTGSLDDGYLPADVQGLGERARAVATGNFFACALTERGAVKCWGANEDGQLGNSSTQNKMLPAPVRGIDRDATAIVAGAEHACAVVGEPGNVRCWGNNTWGQLGNEIFGNHSEPAEIEGLSGVRMLAAGGDHTCALTRAGAVLCWGRYAGGTSRQGRPQSIISGGGTEIDAAGGHTCVLLEGGKLRCFGDNYSGALGIFGGSEGAPF